jgi:hypothetical protein
MLSPGGSGWLRTLIAAPIFIGSCATMVLLSNARSSNARRHSPRRDMATDGRSLARLHDAIIGNGKTQIASVFGPPHSAAVRGRMGDTWYYPLQPREKLAMAISFDDGKAREVEFFHVPG